MGGPCLNNVCTDTVEILLLIDIGRGCVICVICVTTYTGEWAH